MRAVWISSLLVLLVACGDKGDSGSSGEADDTGDTTPTSTDADADGYDADVDCNDGDAQINPGAEEVCDGVDNDCDGKIDDEDDSLDAAALVQFYADADEDGYGSEEAGTTQACSAPSGYVEDSTDCDDFDETVNPGADEICDGKDNDCDTTTDDADTSLDVSTAGTFYTDQDADGYGNAANPRLACSAPSGYVSDDTDCDDLDKSSYPGAPEVCDGSDNDCDGDTDEDATDAQVWYADSDSDGYGTPETSETACLQPSGFMPNSDDCDDSSAAISPVASEICDSIDNDCDGAVDDADSSVDTSAGGTTYYADDDGDSYGDDDDTTVTCTRPAGYVATGGDCDDTTRSANPGASEVCDSIDNDCDGAVDDADSSVDTSAGGTTYYADDDGDGYGDSAASRSACALPSGYVSDKSDCDDSDEDVNPAAVEVCDDIDNDCDKKIDDYDPGLTDGITWYRDFDADGYGYDDYSVVTCEAPSGYVSTSGDCDDNDADINPDAIEVCDDEDNDCDGDIDTDADPSELTTYYADDDNDGYGSPDDTVADCTQPSGYVDNSADCDDTTGAVSPERDELCDGIDNDCDTLIDDDDDEVDFSRGGSSYYIDADEDGYGDVGTASVDACAAPSGYVSDGSDCDDTDGNVNPAATEVCDDLDNDCDGKIDDEDTSLASASRSTFYADRDGDGYGTSTSSFSRCDAPSGYVSDSTDCDDRDGNINPAATEICDRKDNDCDGDTDDADSSVDASVGGSTWYADGDGDGYGDPDDAALFCEDPASGYVEDDTDCDDSSDETYPSAMERCDDADNDCDGDIDESFIDEGFDGPYSGVSLNGRATRYFFGSDGYVELTSVSSTSQVGSVMISTDIPGDAWYASFDVYIGGGTGADGMGFVFYDADDVSDTYYGTSGGAMGFDNTSAVGYAVELDVNDNGTSFGDPDGNHIAVVDASSYPYTSYDTESSIPTLETSSTTYTIEVYFLEGDIDVYIDGTLYLSTTITDYSLETLRMGWTAATGTLTNYHTLDDIYVGCY